MIFVSCSVVVTCWERADRLAFLYVRCSFDFCHFPIRCPGSAVVLDCIDSRSLPSSLLWTDCVALFDLILYVQVNNFSVMLGQLFLGWTCTKQRLMCLAQRHKTVRLARLELASSRSQGKQSTNQPLRSLDCVEPFVFNIVDLCFDFIFFRIVLSEKQKLMYQEYWLWEIRVQYSYMQRQTVQLTVPGRRLCSRLRSVLSVLWFISEWQKLKYQEY